MISQIKKLQTSHLLIFCFLLCLTTSAQNFDKVNSVYSIPYLRYYTPDLVQQYLGCGLNIAYSSFTFPQGVRDAAHILTNMQSFGIYQQCQPKQAYLKAFGYAQNYQFLGDPARVASTIRSQWRHSNVIIDWKQNKADHIDFLDKLLDQLKKININAFLKVPASYLCKDNNGKPFILGLSNVNKIIVEMYGEEVGVYKNLKQIFTAEEDDFLPTGQYPNRNCPKFPSIAQLKKLYPQISFYIEKTLQQEEPGYLGDQFKEILKNAEGIYNQAVFYDAFPPSIIPL